MNYQIQDLTPDSKRVNIVVQLIAKAEPRYAKGFKIVTFMAADSTGQIPIPFWNNESEMVKVGDYIEIENGYVSTFKDKMQLNIGKYGSFQHVDPPEEFQIGPKTTPQVNTAGDEDIEDYIPIEDLEQQVRNLTLRVFIKKKIEERSVITKKDGKPHRVTVFLVGDATGCIMLNLWDESAELADVGTSVIIRGGYVRPYLGQRYLNIARDGRIDPAPIDVRFNSANNLSEKITIY